jgi:ribonuclease R
MSELSEQILALLRRRNYQPLKPKALARKLGVSSPQYTEFKRAIRSLLRDGRIEIGKNHTVRPAPPHGTVTGTYRRATTGIGFVRPQPVDGRAGPEVRIREEDSLDAATGDVVLVKITRKPNRPDLLPQGQVLRVLERATRQFVGTYFERDGEGLVRVDGTVFAHSILVGDPGAKGARVGDKVVFEMVRFPGPEDRGEGVITEVLGPHGQSGVDTLSVIRAYNIPDVFSDDALQEARDAAEVFREDDLHGREDFTDQLVVTIDPVDARDFDDAVGLTRDEKTGHWELAVHIADVGHFVPPGGALDREARNRATSVYLPQRVVPMLPELISNHLASLQPGKVRYVKSVHISLTADGKKTGIRFTNGAIRSRRRFTYEEVMTLLEEDTPAAGTRSTSASPGKTATGGTPAPRQHRGGTLVVRGDTFVSPEIRAMLLRMRDLALILRQRRRKRGALELNMPEVELEYDEQGRVTGGRFRKHDLSHVIIEEFMLAANEAVAEHLDGKGGIFLRRVHPNPDPFRLSAFADFARSLGYKMPTDFDRFALQRILERSADQPEVYAVHYALLRSLKQAVYSPNDEGHYALASDDYCHFTSPIRRYPDLTVHRQLGQWLRTGKVGGNYAELVGLGDHCSKMERRAEAAERDLVKLKLLTYLSERLGLELEVIITGVADYGFFGQGEMLPVEGLVHVSTLTDDYYWFEEATHSLTGRSTNRRFRLGDKVHVKVVRVDLQRRQLDFRVVQAVELAERREEKREGTHRRRDSRRK